MNKEFNNKIKIAYLSDSIYPYHKGGKEKRLYDVSTRMAEREYDVTIYCMKWWEGDNEIVENGVKLCGISPYYQLYHGERRSILQGVMFGFHSLKMLWKDFDVLDADHMPYFPLYSAKIVCLLRGKKLIGTWNEVWGLEYWKKYLGFKGYIAALLEKLTFLTPDTIISISEYTTKRIREQGYKKRIATIPLSVDYELIQSVEPATEESDLIYAGRLLEHKNVDILLKAVARLTKTRPDLKCIIIGDGPERSNLEALSEELGIDENVKFHGFIEKHDDVLAHMKSSKVFVFPSTREGFGLVVSEANACGLPIVTTNHKDNASKELIIESVNGLSVFLATEDFEQAIDRLLQNHKPTKELDTVTWEDTIDAIEDIYCKN